MNLSEYAVSVVLLSVPGLIAFLIIDKLTIHDEIKLHYIAGYSLLLGLISYSLHYAGLLVLSGCFSFPVSSRFAVSLSSKDLTIDFGEVVTVSIIGAALGLIIAYGMNRNWFYGAARKMGVTDIHSSNDVWLDSLKEYSDGTWVSLRDQKNNLVYQGWIRYYSDTPSKRELFLREVLVFDNKTGEHYYQTDGLYLAFSGDNHTIEYQKITAPASEEPAKGQEE